MNNTDIRETPIWMLYEKGRNFHRLKKIYSDTDRNYQFYNGDQWQGAKLGDVEPVQKNFIKPIVKYKCAVIHDNLYMPIFSSQNHESREFQKESERYCDMLNGYARRVWEADKMDFKARRVTKDAAINDEGIMYVYWDDEKQMPVNEIVKKNDIYYGNENDEEIQNQPYILIRKRMPVANAVEFATLHGVSEEEARLIIGDNDTLDESGEDAKEEVDNQTTLVYKFYKKDGTVRFSVSSRYVDILEDQDSGISLYPVGHFTWEEKEGSARGEGEVRYLIPNQIEVNRTEMRRVLTVMYQAFPHKIVDVNKVENPAALQTVGGIINTKGQTVDDVHKIVGTLPPAQMSPDVVKLQEDLINVTRDLAGAGDTATGAVNPEDASGRAILAVQQASQAPMTEQKETFKNFIEDLARIWLEYLIAYSSDGIQMEEEVIDPTTGEEYIQVVTIPQVTLKQLQASVKVDVTPKGTYDRFAQEQTIENLFVQGMFSVERLPELEVYYDILPDDSVAPRQAIGEAIEKMREKQRQIAQIQAQAQMLQQKAQQFLMADPEGQAEQISDAQMQLMMMQAAKGEEPQVDESEVIEAEGELPEPEAPEE